MASVAKRRRAAAVEDRVERSVRGKLVVKKGQGSVSLVVRTPFRMSLLGAFPLALAACPSRVWHGGPAIAPTVVDVSDQRPRCACGTFVEYCLPQFCPGAIDNTVEL
jgi:hypothetical protein